MGGGGGGGQGGPNSQQAHDVVTTSMRRNDVASTSFRCRVPIRFLVNQCLIITSLILKYYIIENSRIELRGIVLPVQVGGLLGGPKGMLAPPSQIIGGPAPPPSLAPPLPTPMQLKLASSRVTFSLFDPIASTHREMQEVTKIEAAKHKDAPYFLIQIAFSPDCISSCFL